MAQARRIGTSLTLALATVAAFGQADSPPKMLGDRDLNVLLTPLPRDKRAKNPRERMPELPPEPEESESETEADGEESSS